MNTEKIALIVALVVCGIFWLGPMCIAMRIEDQERKKRGEPPPNKALYDERQNLIRLRAGVHALFALVGYLGLWACLDVFGGQKGGWAWTGEAAPLIFGGVMLAAVVWTVECTLRDAAVGWNQKSGASSQLTVFSTYLLCCGTWGSLFWEEGQFVLSRVMYLTALGLAVMDLAVFFAKRRREKRLEQEDG